MQEHLNQYSGVNLSDVSAIQQKRIIAFVNQFVMTSVELLNNFGQQCEKRMLAFENKIQKIEASLIILETKLSSIPELEMKLEVSNDQTCVVVIPNASQIQGEIDISQETIEETAPEEQTQIDPQYEKFIKMVHVGVPLNAVKLKLKTEGLDPDILDKYLIK